MNLLRTNGNIPQYRSLRSFKIKDYRIKGPKSPVCYYANYVATYNAVLESGDIEKNPGPGFDIQSRKNHNATTNKSTSKKASSTKCSICNKGV